MADDSEITTTVLKKILEIGRAEKLAIGKIRARIESLDETGNFRIDLYELDDYIREITLADLHPLAFLIKGKIKGRIVEIAINNDISVSNVAAELKTTDDNGNFELWLYDREKKVKQLAFSELF